MMGIRSSWLKVASAGLGAILFSGPVVADEPQLTPYEQSLACKLSQTCDATDAGAIAGSDSGEIVRDEAPFQIFSSRPQQRSASAAPRSAADASSRSVGSGPKLYVGSGTAKSLAGATGSGIDKRRSRFIARQPAAPIRKNAADMNVLFGNASADIEAADMREIKNWSNVLKTSQFSAKRIRIEGHTNSVGSRDYNIELSQRRAKTVMDYLVSQGIAADRLDAKGFGFDRPRVSDGQSAVNRRVEIVTVD